MKKRILSITLALLMILGCMAGLIPETHAATTNQQHIVDRADYLWNTTWYCRQTVSGWGGTFYAGNTYHLPYGQPVYSGAYIGFGVSVDSFKAAAATPGSVFYTGRSHCGGTTAPYYATDCSAFVSWCWGVGRRTTYSLPQISSYLGMANSSNVYNLQLGDALNSNSVGHVVLVTGLSYSGGRISQIEITEQTPPQLKRSYYTPAQLANKYGRNYGIYRYYGNVPAAPGSSSGRWAQSGGNWYYYNASGVKQTGWIQDNGQWYYLNGSGVMQTGWLSYSGDWYYLTSSGAMQIGWALIGGTWYYFDADGAMQTGWIKSGDWYYCDSSGAMQTGWIKVDGKWYYMDSLGAMQTGWIKLSDNNRYYLNSSGAMQTGWVKDSGAWYHLNASGVMDTGWFQDQTDRFYLNTSGVMQTGWVKISDSWYYFGPTGRMVTGWLNDGGRYYYLDDKGIMVTGSQTIDGVSYVFGDSGALVSGTSPIENYLGDLPPVDLGKDFYAHIGYPNGGWNLTLDGVDVRVLTYDKTTSPAQIWRFIRQSDGSYKIVNQKTGMCLDVRDGSDQNGAMIRIYADNGSDAQRWYVYEVNGGYALRPKCASQSVLDVPDASTDCLTLLQLYSFNSSTAQTFSIDKICDSDANGNMQSGWFKCDGNWYFLNDQDAMQTGWLKDKDTWYYLDDRGVMQTGWRNIGNTWYYFNSSGAMQTGWIQSGNARYYCGDNGAMKTGWLLDENSWYYLNADGSMQIGWIKLSDNNWYYLNSSGKMVTGWLDLGNTWYYLNSSGCMVTGSQTIDGKTYQFNSSGAMISGSAPQTQTLNGMIPEDLGSDFYAHIGYPNGGWNLTLDGIDVRVLTYNKTTSPAQIWRFIRQSDGSYKIVNKKTGKCLDVRDGSDQNGTMIRIYADNGSDAQRWYIYEVNGGYVLQPKCAPGSVLDVPNASTACLTLTQLYSFNGSAAQKFTITKTDSTANGAAPYSTYTGGMAGDGYIRAYGIDVSEWQGSGFDFQNLKNNGYSYVILRCGTSNRKDYRFEEYYAAARAAGLNIGVYFYSYATNAAEASRDADLCLSYIAGKKFEYPVYFDFEDPSARSYDGNMAYSICTTFLDKVAARGYLAGMYSSASWIDPNYNGWVPVSSICSKYECWIANYYNNTPNNVKSANYASTYGMYQYTSSNYVGGVGPLDTNVCYKDYPTIVKENHLNGY